MQSKKKNKKNEVNKFMKFLYVKNTTANENTEYVGINNYGAFTING